MPTPRRNVWSSARRSASNRRAGAPAPNHHAIGVHRAHPPSCLTVARPDDRRPAAFRPIALLASASLGVLTGVSSSGSRRARSLLRSPRHGAVLDECRQFSAPFKIGASDARYRVSRLQTLARVTLRAGDVEGGHESCRGRAPHGPGPRRSPIELRGTHVSTYARSYRRRAASLGSLHPTYAGSSRAAGEHVWVRACPSALAASWPHQVSYASIARRSPLRRVRAGTHLDALALKHPARTAWRR